MLNFVQFLSVALAFTLFFANDAYAYLDPGTGSVILQVLAAAVLGALFTIKSYWHSLKALFSKKKRNDDNDSAK